MLCLGIPGKRFLGSKNTSDLYFMIFILYLDFKKLYLNTVYYNINAMVLTTFKSENKKIVYTYIKSFIINFVLFIYRLNTLIVQLETIMY